MVYIWLRSPNAAPGPLAKQSSRYRAWRLVCIGSLLLDLIVVHDHLPLRLSRRDSKSRTRSDEFNADLCEIDGFISFGLQAKLSPPGPESPSMGLRPVTNLICATAS